MLAMDETVKKDNFYFYYNIKSQTRPTLTHPEQGTSTSIQINETVILL